MCLVAFATVLVIVPFTGAPTIDIKILIYSWGGSLLAVAFVIWSWRQNRPLRRPRIFPGILAVFLLLFVIACLTSSHKATGLVTISRFVSLFVLYWVACQIFHTPKHVQRLMLVICVAVALSELYGFVQRAGLDPFPWDTSGLEKPFDEMPGTFGHGNIAAHATVLCIIMAAYLSTVSKNLRWCLILLPLYVSHMYFSHQRGGLVGVAAAAVLLVLVKLVHRRVQRPLRAVAIGMVLFCVVGLVAIGGVMGLKKVQTGVPYPTDRPILLRYHAYSGAARMIMERPLLGFGPGNYRIENPRYWTPFEQEHFAVDRKMNYNTHCDVLEIGTEAGLPAAGVYLTFLFVAIGCGLLMGLTDNDPSRRRFGLALAAFFCAFMVDGFFGFNLRVPVTASMLFIMAGALEGVWTGDREEKRAQPVSSANWLAGGALVVLALLPACVETRVYASEVLLQRGKGALHWKVYDEAEKILARGEALAPWNWEFAHRRGEAALYQRDPATAIDHFKRALSQHPNRVMVRAALAIATMRLAAGESPPGTPSPAQDLTTQLQLLEDAKSYARDALALCPVLSEAEDVWGRAAALRATALERQAAQGSVSRDEIVAAWQEAEEHLNLAIDYGAKKPDEIYNALAIAQIRLGREIETADSLVRALNANPANEMIWPTFTQFAKLRGHTDLLSRFAIRTKNKLRSAGDQVFPALEAVTMVWEQGPDSLNEATALLAVAARTRSSAQIRLPPQAGLVWAAELLADELQKAERSDTEGAIPKFNLALVYTAEREWNKADRLFGESVQYIPENWPPGELSQWVDGQMRLIEYARPNGALKKARSAIEDGAAPDAPNPE